MKVGLMRYTVLLLALLVAVTTASCGTPAAAPAVTCGVLVDGSGSTAELNRRLPRIVGDFVAGNACTTARVVVISANSPGETCKQAAPLALTEGMRTDPSNVESRRAEFERDRVPLVVGQARQLLACVARAGTGDGTDVVGAFGELARTLPSDAPDVRVLVVSDMVDTVRVDVVGLIRDGRTGAVVSELRSALPPMSGWTVTAAGAGFGTTALSPVETTALQAVWADAVGGRGARYVQPGA
ncbi:hypothetical protein [Pseudonocardia alni]|uniref:hypothetical protein n=1 Tax=Pseudonocardia alni TaxID=33907 RepID=UPI0027A03CC5|nr:hypothetical protein PaSha_12775 [Pseudonocardia alni]